MGAEPVHVWHMVFVLPSMQNDAGELKHEEDSSAEVMTGGGDGGDGSAGGGAGGNAGGESGIGGGGEGTTAT